LYHSPVNCYRVKRSFSNHKPQQICHLTNGLAKICHCHDNIFKNNTADRGVLCGSEICERGGRVIAVDTLKKCAPVIYTKYLRCYDAEKFFETWLAIVDISGRKICPTIYRCELRGKPYTHWPPSSTRHSLETEFQVNEKKREKKTVAT
jgi:hypothetical protein